MLESKSLTHKKENLKKVIIILTIGILCSSRIFCQSCIGPLAVVLDGATSADSLHVDVEASGISCSTESTGNINLIVNGGNGGYQFDWADDLAMESFRDSLSTGSYSVTITDSEGCEEVIEANIAILTNENSELASNSGCGNCLLTNGTSSYFFNEDADYIAELIDDPDDMIDLGDTEVCLNQASAPGDCNGNPFLERSWSVSPSVDQTSCVKLFFKQDEFEALAAEMADVPTPSPDFLVMNNKLCLTGFSGGLEDCQDYNSAKTYSQSDANPLEINLVDSIAQIWSVDICLTEYATFYFHICELPLPVNLISFYGEKNGQHNLIQWVTENEAEIEKYEVEFSRNTNNWKSLSEHTARDNQATNQLNFYQIMHNKPGRGLYYYRLKITEFDQTQSYSNVIAINRRSDRPAQFTPNLFEAFTSYEAELKKDQYLQFLFFDDRGRVAHRESIYFQKGFSEHLFNLSHLPAAGYFVTVTSSDRALQETYKLIKQ